MDRVQPTVGETAPPLVGPLRPWPARPLDFIASACATLTTVALVADCIIVIVAVIFRYFLDSPLTWSDDAATLALVTITFLGAALPSVRGSHLGVDLWAHRLSSGGADIMLGFREAVGAGLLVAIATGGLRLVQLDIGQESAGLPITKAAFDIPLVAGACLIALIATMKGTATRRSAAAFVLTGAVIALLQTFGTVGVATVLSSAAGTLALTILVPVILIVLGVPMAFSLGWGAMLYFVGTPLVSLTTYAQQFDAGVRSSILLAVPFFIFAGNLMQHSGMAKRLIDGLGAIVGGVRGSLGLVFIGGMVVFSGISGSKTADMAAVGGVMLPSVRRDNPQEADRATALLAAAGAMSETIPPSLAILVLGSVTSISVGDMFLGGLLPALCIAGLLAVAVVWRGELAYAATSASVRSRVGSVAAAAPAFVMPAVIVVPILLGIATPTEASAVAVGYGALAGAIGGRLRPRACLTAAADAISLTASVMLVIAAAGLVGYVLVLQGIPQDIASWVAAAHVGGPGYLVLMIGVFVAISPVFEGLPPIIIFGPLLLPSAVELGVSPVQFGMVLILATGLGVFLPPFGVSLFTAAAVGQTTMQRIARPALRYLAVVAVGTVIVALVPALSTWLPKVAGP